jgi:serine/threonine protein kinase/formylglycine-generating enzyme required for sulfatase activity
MEEAISAAERERLEDLFAEAVGLPSAQHRAFVARECADHPALAAELERLLAALSGEDLLHGIQQQPTTADLAGTCIGPYRLEARIGQGGMGDVWSAQQLEPVTRRVALKLIRPGMESAQVVARFQAERQALARMSHPHVAQVLGGGTSDDGRPYFVMEYVEGETLTAYCDRHALPTRARLELLLDVCAGVRHAHQKGLVHRDLKPGNLLVACEGDRPLVKVIDFGVARATTGQLAGHTLHTLMGQLVGTLDYMSPEQADLGGVDVDTRSDVYSLGVVLYELISGCLPFDHQLAVDRSLAEIQRTIREQDPPTPSTRLTTGSVDAAAVARRRGVDERRLRRELQGDLDWICLRALEKDPERRYASVAELADDLVRHLAFEPVKAHRPSPVYRASRFVRRHRVAVAAGAVVVAALFTGGWGVVSGRLQAELAESRAAELKRLYAVWRVEPLIAEADRLWPAVPARIAAMEDWMDRARSVVASLAGYREALSALGPGTDGSASSDGRSGQPADVLAGLWTSPEELARDLLAEDGASPIHGESVPRRLEQARALGAGFAAGGAYAQAWAEKLPAIRDAYPGLDLAPQLGLLPLGSDPVSGLWEFAHLLSGEPARRLDGDGELERDEGTGLVLVLLPGGTFYAGSQNDDPEGPNYVKPGRAGPRGAPPLPLKTVAPLFVSKYEVTRSQWRRVTLREPLAEGSDLAPDHPVTLVDWRACQEFCERMDLTLPDEFQWEYAARGGTTTRWWIGDDAAAVWGCFNVFGTITALEAEDLDSAKKDVFERTAPVGSFRANPFGLHDVIGNVFEWTTSHPLPIGDQAPEPQVGLYRMARGGGFMAGPGMAGSASRGAESVPEFVSPQMGFRPVRPVDRPVAD